MEDRYTRPQGLYPHPDIDLRKLRRLIVEAKLAPCHPGADDPRADLDECPICFLVCSSSSRRPLRRWIRFCSDALSISWLVRAVLPQPQPLQVLRQGDLYG